MTAKTQIREAVKSALRAAPSHWRCTVIPVWQREIDAETLPIIAVDTPSEAVDQDAYESSLRSVSLQVIYKRLGEEDIADRLDEDQVTIHKLVADAVIGAGYEVLLERIETSVDGTAARPVGTLTMTFSATYRADNP